MNAPLVTAVLATTLVVAGCSSDAGDPDATVTSTEPATETTASAESSTSATSQTDADIDVDSGTSPSADAQDAEGSASLGTAFATIEITLPGQWQYEGTYGDGALPYAVLVDASQAFDLSEPGSDAYKESVWLQVETYRVGDQWPYGDATPDDPAALGDQIAEATGGSAEGLDGRDVSIVHATYEEDGQQIDDLYALHGDVWILARAHNVDVPGYVDGEDVEILTAVLETSQIK
ncbi:hypothetical protein [Demequina flava]|uniref:hypothetical protein n=1 Tax=Demequina flava TaxID=1095025 RepID=UPI000B0774C3|nr:hypothetical protein [Demequina flava]